MQDFSTWWSEPFLWHYANQFNALKMWGDVGDCSALDLLWQTYPCYVIFAALRTLRTRTITTFWSHSLISLAWLHSLACLTKLITCILGRNILSTAWKPQGDPFLTQFFSCSYSRQYSAEQQIVKCLVYCASAMGICVWCVGKGCQGFHML